MLKNGQTLLMERLKFYIKPVLLQSCFLEVLDSNIAALDREQALQREIQQLRLLFEDERKHKNKLQFELKSQEKQWELNKDEICSNYDRVVRDLHDEINVMKKKVEFETNDNKHLQHIKTKSDSVRESCLWNGLIRICFLINVWADVPAMK